MVDSKVLSELIDTPIMTSNVIGRVKNLKLPKKNALYPLFEAIINSIDSIEAKGKPKKGIVEVHIKRDKQRELEFEDEEQTVPPITGFSIIDNGVGFNKENLKSFCTSDSRYKETKGGKGIGRFTWLKAFDKASIESSYKINETFYELGFDFVLDDNPIQEYTLKKSDKKSEKTVVNLKNVKKNYKDEIPKTNVIIAERILRHFLIIFLNDSCPKITVYDSDAEPIQINSVFEGRIKPYITNKKFKIGENNFAIDNVRVQAAGNGSINHMVHLCADRREVVSESLIKHLHDLSSECLFDDVCNEEFYLISYVAGKYLDENVNAERTGFAFEDEEADQRRIDGLSIAKNEIMHAVVIEIKDEFKESLHQIEQDKLQRVKKFIQNERPIYTPVLKYASESLRKIPANVKGAKLDIEIHKAFQKLEIELKEEGKRLEDVDLETIKDDDEYEIHYEEYINKIKELNSARLAEYVLHRKTIIDLLTKSLRAQENGSYRYEKWFHNLIYPMKETSDSKDSIDHNLWVIDEKLTYHSYIASDIPLNKIAVVSTDSEERPDLFICPVAFVEGEYPYNAIVLIELKRPERTSYDDTQENPDKQVIRYIKGFKAGKIKDKDGLSIPAKEDTRFYCYIVADITPKLKELLIDSNYKRTIDDDGFYYYHDQHHAYIEVIGYRKLLEDAKKRNRALFDKLGLPYS